MSTDDKKVCVKISERAIASLFLNIGYNDFLFPWERQIPGEWWTIEGRVDRYRQAITFVAKCNGVDRHQTELPVALLFDWLPRLLTAAEQGMIAARAAEADDV